MSNVGITYSAALHHPDKVAETNSQSNNEYFLHLKEAQDILLSPTKRFAYDRFGPDMLAWKHCSSARDYLLAGLQAYAPFYVGSATFLGLLSVAGYLQWGRFVCHPCAASFYMEIPRANRGPVSEQDTDLDNSGAT